MFPLSYGRSISFLGVHQFAFVACESAPSSPSRCPGIVDWIGVVRLHSYVMTRGPLDTGPLHTAATIMGWESLGTGKFIIDIKWAIDFFSNK